MNHKTKKDDMLVSAKLPRHKRFFRLFPPITIILIIFILAFGIGFVLFAEMISREQPPENVEVVDGIVVLTGGTKRLETGFELLNEQKAKRLLISGVNPGTNRKTLIIVTGTDSNLFDCCVDLGHEAADTIGNARETADWAKQHNFKTLYVVTNDYHMPRSILELKRAMPNLTLIPYPVIADPLEEESWWKWSDKQRLIFFEYIKYIGTHILNMSNF